MTGARVTVIVPTYHHAQLLRQTLLSIFNSTVPVKIIIVPVLDDLPTIDDLQKAQRELVQEFKGRMCWRQKNANE